MDKQKTSARRNAEVFFISRLRRAPVRGAGFILLVKWLALRAGAPVAWGRFFLSVKWLCAPRGPERRAGFFFELVLALVARGWFFLLVKWLCAPRGPERSFIQADCSLLMSKENQKTTSDFDALDPRERGCSPLSDPKEEVEVEKC